MNLGFSFPYRTSVESIQLAANQSLAVERLASLDETIDGYFAEYERTGRSELFEDLCPYFGVPWPAGVALARFAAQEAEHWQGRRVLELGCGLALPSLVLARAGCFVTATDLHPDVPAFLERNLARNAIAGALEIRLLDWRATKDLPGAELLLASDVLYDRTQPAALLLFLQEAPFWREAWFADPGRGYWDGFVELLRRESAWDVFEELRDGVFMARVRR